MSTHHSSLDKRRWARVRAEVLSEVGYRCERCGRAGRLEVHHCTALRDGGDPYERGNLEVLCRSCHIAEGGTVPVKGRREWRDRLNAIIG